MYCSILFFLFSCASPADVHPERSRAELGSKHRAVPPEELKVRDEFYVDDLLRYTTGTPQ